MTYEREFEHAKVFVDLTNRTNSKVTFIGCDQESAAADDVVSWMLYNNTSCERTHGARLPTPPGKQSCALGECQALCIANEECRFINHADSPGSLSCDLYSSCDVPFCLPGAQKWWNTYQLTSRNSTSFPGCAPGPGPAPAPHPTPTYKLAWPATYNMSLSTISNPDGNYTGFDEGGLLHLDARFGIINFDGQFQMCLNSRDGPPDDPCKYRSTQADVEEQARHIKSINPHTRVFTYHNQEQGLLRRKQDCLIMTNASYNDFWIHNSTAIVNNRIALGHRSFCDAVAPPSSYTYEDQYALDFRKAKVTQWWLENVIGDFIKSPVLDGFYWDNPGSSKPYSDALTDIEKQDVNAAMLAARDTGHSRIAAAGKWALDMFGGIPTPNSCNIGCSLWWRVSQNCTKICDSTPKTCMSQLKRAAIVGENPSRMVVPMVDSWPTLVGCDSPATVVEEGSADDVELSCVPGTGTLDVDFASYGQPLIASATGRFIKPDTTCPSQFAGATFWEDTSTHEVYKVESSPCAACLHTSPPTCSATSVGAADWSTLRQSYQPFSCDLRQKCTAFATNSSCDAGPSVLKYIQSQCNGRQSCSIKLHDLPPPPGNCPASGPANPLRLAVRSTGCKQGTSVASFRQHLAGFLLTRGSHSWMGQDWIASKHPQWHPEWDVRD